MTPASAPTSPNVSPPNSCSEWTVERSESRAGPCWTLSPAFPEVNPSELGPTPALTQKAVGGFVGAGMLAAACPGAMFTSPTPDQVSAAAAAVDGGAGVLLIVKNYTGDVLNVETAAELMDAEGTAVRTVLVDDDVAVKDSTWTAGRRGVGGTVLVEEWRRGDSPHSLTLYHRDGAGLVATHYCPQGNQPRLALTPASTATRLDFAFRDATDLDPATESHQHALAFDLTDPARPVRSEVYRSAKGDEPDTLVLVRD